MSATWRAGDNYGTTSGALWTQGDSDYNGAVDVGDLGALATNYGLGAGSPLSTSSIAAPAASAAPFPNLLPSDSSSSDSCRLHPTRRCLHHV